MADLQIPPLQLTIAVVCTALAMILLLFMLIRGVIRRISQGRRYGSNRSTYSAGSRKRRGFYASDFSVIPHHSRPSSSNRRYGKGYRPATAPKRRKKVSRRKYGTFHYHGHTDTQVSEDHSFSEIE